MRRTWSALLVLILIVLAGWAGWHWWARSDSAAWYQAALVQLDQGNGREAVRYAGLLAQNGNDAEAHVIRGKLSRQDAERELRRLADDARGTAASDWLLLQCERAAASARPFPVPCPPLGYPSQVWSVLRRDTLQPWTERGKAALTQAIAEFESVAEQSPLRPEAMTESVECLQQLKQLGAAVSPTEVERRLREVLNRQPENERAHRALAALYIDMNAAGPAITHLRHVGRLDPKDGRPFRLIGWLYKGYLKNGAALDAYREALLRQLEPRVHAEVIEEMVELLVEADSRQGLEQLDHTESLYRHRSAWLTLRGECLANLGRPEEALPLLEQALQADPNLTRALLLRGKLALALERPKEAVPYLQRAVRADPLDHKALHQLVTAYRQLGLDRDANDQQRAADAAQKLKRKLTDLYGAAIDNPWDAAVRFEIAQIWLGVDRPVDAAVWLRAVLICDPQHEGARTALARLEGTTLLPAPQKR